MKNNKKTLYYIFILFLNIVFIQDSIAQKFKLANEKVVFTFQTKNGKQVFLCKDSSNNYLVYRFGTKDKIEFEYPKIKDKTSWKKFAYSGWLRGGGIRNEGIDLNYLAFINEQTKYVLFYTYFANGERAEVGIRVIDLKTNKTTIIWGIKRTQKGGFSDIQELNLVSEGEELYD